MTNEYVLATNDDGDLAVRTVSATEASGITDTQNVITRTEDGKLAIRTVGSGGGGGGSVDKNKIINKATSLPAASASNAGQVYMYDGADTEDYTHGYIYECVTDDNTTYYWKQMDVQPSVKVNTTATLAVADWTSNTQTVNVTGITANGVVLVSPTPANQSAYTSAGILCTAQAAGSLTFTCDTVPSADITVTVVML